MAEPRGPLLSPGFWLHHAALTWRQRVDAGLRDLGLTHTQFDLLASSSWLGREGTPPTQQQAARMAGADRMMASKVASGLEARGLLRREAHPTDTRAKLLVVTPAGRELVLRAVRVVARVDADLFGEPGPTRERLLTELRGIAERHDLRPEAPAHPAS